MAKHPRTGKPAAIVRSGHKDGRYYISIRMSREIKNPTSDMQVDHRNGNIFDNQRRNLRICTNHQNNRNKGKQSNNTTGFKGVYYIPTNRGPKKFHARLGSRKEHGIFHGGYHLTAIGAARRYDELARKHYGKFAKLNFP